MLPDDQSLTFGPFQLDSAKQTLWKGAERLPLTRKSFVVLRYLVERPQQLVTKQELLERLWPDTTVGEAVLKTCMTQIRRALNDQAENPTFIETVHGHGYRFLGFTPEHHDPSPPGDSSDLFGRDDELAQLQTALQQMLQGHRQLVFITGEPGIGKTSLANTFATQVGMTSSINIGYGQCIEQYGSGEAYLPFLEALSRVCRQPGGDTLRALLHQHAPTWLIQLPGLLEPADRQAFLPKVIGATPIRMMRELADALEMFTTTQPLMLCLEDLHWLDPSSVELLNYLARQSGLAQLLILGTYRPTDLIQFTHPLNAVKHDLHIHGLCQELALQPLTETQTTHYLSSRLDQKKNDRHLLASLARTIHGQTDGNPLFIVNLVNYLLSQGLLVHTNHTWQLTDPSKPFPIPSALGHFLMLRMAQLTSETRALLEVASVAGKNFSTTVISAGLEIEPEQIDRQCHALAQTGQFIQEIGLSTWPDQTITMTYQFCHTLYQNTLYENLLPARRVALHRQMGERLVQAYGSRCQEIAPALALHFERGQEPNQASLYHQQAGEDAFQRNTPHEATRHLTKALAILHTLPQQPDHSQRELRLQYSLGLAHCFSEGFGSPEARKAFERSLELVRQSSDPHQLFPVLFGLLRYYGCSGQAKIALDQAEHLIQLTERSPDPAIRALAHEAKGVASVFHGDFHTGQKHAEFSLSIDLPESANAIFMQCGEDPRNVSPCFLGFALWARGYPDQARKVLQHHAMAYHNHLIGVYRVSTQIALALFHRMNQEYSEALQVATTAIAMSKHEGFPHWYTEGAIIREWVTIMMGQGAEGDLISLDQSLAQLTSLGHRGQLTIHLAAKAEVCLHTRQYEAGLATIVDGLQFVQETGNHWFEAELIRLRGELLMATDQSNSQQTAHDAEACFHESLNIAQKQDAKIFELRAMMSLSRLWQQQGHGKKAFSRLHPLYDWFTEGFGSRDLQEAKIVLDSLEE